MKLPSLVILYALSIKLNSCSNRKCLMDYFFSVTFLGKPWKHGHYRCHSPCFVFPEGTMCSRVILILYCPLFCCSQCKRQECSVTHCMWLSLKMLLHHSFQSPINHLQRRQPEHPGAQPEVLSTILWAVAWTCLEKAQDTLKTLSSSNRFLKA